MAEKELPRWLRIAQLWSQILTPVIVAVLGWWIQGTLAHNSTRLGYLQVAVGILKDPPSEASRPLRSWAVDIFRKNSEIEVTDEIADQLRDGKIVLPGFAFGAGVIIGTNAFTGTATGGTSRPAETK